jgi:hypothetical protein
MYICDICKWGKFIKGYPDTPFEPGVPDYHECQHVSPSVCRRNFDEDNEDCPGFELTAGLVSEYEAEEGGEDDEASN